MKKVLIYFPPEPQKKTQSPARAPEVKEILILSPKLDPQSPRLDKNTDLVATQSPRIDKNTDLFPPEPQKKDPEPHQSPRSHKNTDLDQKNTDPDPQNTTGAQPLNPKLLILRFFEKSARRPRNPKPQTLYLKLEIQTLIFKVRI